MSNQRVSAADRAAEFELSKAEPQDQELWDKVVTEAKKKFKSYPSFFASMWVTNTYKKRGGKFKGGAGKDDKKPAFLKSDDAGAQPELVPGGEELPEADKARLVKLRQAHTDARPIAQALAHEAGHPLAVSIGADCEAFIGAQLGSLAVLLDDEGDARDAPTGYGDLLLPEAEESSLAEQLDRATYDKLMRLAERLPQVDPTDEGAAEVPTSKAFVTAHAGKTLITGPAAAFTGGWQKALSANEHMMWIQGRLVGGETPNRNNALWTAGDLEMGQPTVAHGPLNWLHEARHVIGSIADSRFVPAAGSEGKQTAAATRDPHIIAAAGIWNWLYPDEAMVVQQASDLNQLWYSMECISDRVICSGEGGCGHDIDYFTFARDEPGTCEHMRQRSTVLRFAQPTFLGAAVIVPPTRPGWADADASVLAEAASQSEKAFEQAGKPDIPASTFEQMMAQVLKYAEAR